MSTLIGRLIEIRDSDRTSGFACEVVQEAITAILDGQAERDALKAALKPFADEKNYVAEWWANSADFRCDVTVGDLRRARAALAEPTRKPEIER